MVTGAGRRVGRAIVLELASAGLDVAIHYHRSEQPAREVGEAVLRLGRRALVVAGDLADPAVPERLVGEVAVGLGRLDVLVNSAAGFERMDLHQLDAAAWTRTLAVNTVAPALLVRAAADLMRTGGRGRIINLLDVLAERGIPGYAAYVASKAALAAVTRCLALELAPDITVNGVAPGIAEFPDDFDQATRDRLIERVPLRRAGTPEEVARLVRFLAVEAGYITGAIIPIDGGRSARF